MSHPATVGSTLLPVTSPAAGKHRNAPDPDFGNQRLRFGGVSEKHTSHCGFDECRRDRHDARPLWCECHRQRLGRSLDGVLRCTVQSPIGRTTCPIWLDAFTITPGALSAPCLTDEQV